MERAEAETILDGDREAAIALLMRVGELVEANRRLEARVAELERRLNRSSRNSSLPPSQDPPSAPPRPGEPASGRRRGGQPGHEGRSRRLLPLERLDEVVEHWPARCAHCARRFGESERIEAASRQRHQVCELPTIAVTVTEHRLHRLRCPACAAETRAGLPADVPQSAFGPRLQAAVTTLAVRNRVSRRDSAELMRELFAVELSTGALDAIVQRVGEALAEPQARLAEQIRSAAVHRPQRGPRRAEAVRRSRPHAYSTSVRRLGRLPGPRRPRPTARVDRVAPSRAQGAARAGDAQEHEDEVPERLPEVGFVGPAAPLSRDQLQAMTVEEVVTFLRDWQPSEDDWHAPSREGAARLLRHLVAEDPERFAVGARAFSDVDPTYAHALLAVCARSAPTTAPSTGRPVLDLALAILDKPRLIEGRDPTGFDGNDPGWAWTWQELAHLIGAGFAGDGALPREERERVWQLLARLADDEHPASPISI